MMMRYISRLRLYPLLVLHGVEGGLAVFDAENDILPPGVWAALIYESQKFLLPVLVESPMY